MDIYIDIIGLKEYLKQFFNAIRNDNDKKNNSVFNISFKNMLIDKTLKKQKIVCDLSLTKENDKSVPIKDRYMNGRSLLKKSLDKFFVDETGDFKEDFDNWLKDLDVDSSSRNTDCTKSKFQQESALSINEDIPGNNPFAIIDTSNILEELYKRFFVDKESCNRVLFTRDMRGWGSIRQTMEFEKDIIIVDRFFFRAHYEDSVHEISDTESLDFIKQLCGKRPEVKKNVVIFYENDKDRLDKEKLRDLAEKVKDYCDITYVGLNNKWAKEKLHDRVIISNYRIICCGHSFPQFFDYNTSNDKQFSANGSMFLTIGSVADKNNEKVMNRMLDYLQQEIIDNDENNVFFIYSMDDVYRSNLLTLHKPTPPKN